MQLGQQQREKGPDGYQELLTYSISCMRATTVHICIGRHGQQQLVNQAGKH